MTVSTIARPWLALLSLAAFTVSSVLGQRVQPSNDTLPTGSTSSMVQLRIGGSFSTPPSSIYAIAPLTNPAGMGQSPTAVSAISISGFLMLVEASNIKNLTTSSIAYVNCDQIEGRTSPSEVVGLAGNVRPRAIVLFSLETDHCLLEGSYTYNTIYTMTSLADSRILDMTISYNNAAATNPLNARIGNPSGQGGQGNQNNIDSPAPTTAVAMSILYSITGIITLLFLVIIATGAIRAHRHPERYGPRAGFAGRPRQSRAKGLARAMLETLPIVKFGDPEPVKPANQDVELASQTVQSSPGVVSNEQPEMTGVAAVASPAVVESGMGPAQDDGSIREKETPHEEGELVCSICTEEFVTGEDVRVLPCNHKYHPACVDPWLLNVSGTCPLCRHDLRPVATNTSGTAPDTESDLPPPLNATEGGEVPEPAPVEDTPASAPQQRRRISRFIDVHRLRHAPPDERIAALRHLREQTQQEGAAGTGSESAEGEGEERVRRASLAARLSHVFRIRTSPAEVHRSEDGAGVTSSSGRRFVYRV